MLRARTLLGSRGSVDTIHVALVVSSIYVIIVTKVVNGRFKNRLYTHCDSRSFSSSSSFSSSLSMMNLAIDCGENEILRDVKRSAGK